MNDIDALFLSTLQYLTYRPRSEKEIRDYLKKKLTHFPTLNNSVIDLIVERLKKQRFLDDREFASMWIRSRTQFKPKGERLVRLELLQKGVSKDIIDEAFITFHALQEMNKESVRDDLHLAVEILEKKREKYENLNRQERFNKAGSMLARRGFDFDTIKAAIDQIFEK